MPYRSKLIQSTPTISRSRQGDRDLLPMWVLLWVAAALRVAVAMLHHETFRAEATLALIVAALVPWLVLSSAKAHRASRFSKNGNALARNRSSDRRPS